MINKFKVWILNKKFFKDVLGDFREDAISEFEFRKGTLYRQAFNDARKDLEETNIYDLNKQAEELAVKKLNDLLSTVDMKKIVTMDKTNGIVYIGGERAEAGRLANLKAETEFFLQSDLWHLIHETPKELAQRTMFVSGETLADLQKGKSILFTLSSQQNILSIFKSYTPRQ